MAKNSKIQVTTIRQMANVEVIAINTSFVAKALKTHFLLSHHIDICTRLDMDEDGRMVDGAVSYANPSIPFLKDFIMPFLQELTDALMGEQDVKERMEDQEVAQADQQ